MTSTSIKLRRVSVGLPFGIGRLDWDPDESERRAAWSLYVELVTRIAGHSLEPEEGLHRDVLASLYQLFPTTRDALKTAGPGVGARPESVGGIAITVLNVGLRPFLSKWHPLLGDWEAHRPPDRSRLDHERAWSRDAELRAELELLRGALSEYAEALATVAGVKR